MTSRHLTVATASIVLTVAISAALILHALNTLSLEVHAVVGAVEQLH